MFKIFRKMWSAGHYSRWIAIGLIVVAIIAVGFVFYTASTSRPVPEDSRYHPEETVKPQPEEDVKPLPEVKEFTERKLVRIPAKGMLGGVLAGFAYYLAVPLWLLRLLFLAGIFIGDEELSGFLIVAYILCSLVMSTIDFIPADFVARTG